MASYQRAVELDPHFAAAHLNLASVIQQRGDPGAALQERRQALLRQPDSALLRILVGHALLFNDRPEDAAAELRTAIAAAPDLAIAHFFLGQALRQLEQPREAKESLSLATRLSPQTAEFHRELGAALLQDAKVEEAVASLRKAVDLDPDNAAAHYQLGNALRRVGKAEEAKRHFQQAAALKERKLEFEQAGLHTLQGITYLRAGNLVSAIDAFRRALAQQPQHAEASYYLGIALAQSGDFEGAAKAFTAALAENREARRFTTISVSRCGNPGNPLRRWRSSAMLSS